MFFAKILYEEVLINYTTKKSSFYLIKLHFYIRVYLFFDQKYLLNFLMKLIFKRKDCNRDNLCQF